MGVKMWEDNPRICVTQRTLNTIKRSQTQYLIPMIKNAYCISLPPVEEYTTLTHVNKSVVYTYEKNKK